MTLSSKTPKLVSSIATPARSMAASSPATTMAKTMSSTAFWSSLRNAAAAAWARSTTAFNSAILASSSPNVASVMVFVISASFPHFGRDRAGQQRQNYPPDARARVPRCGTALASGQRKRSRGARVESQTHTVSRQPSLGQDRGELVGHPVQVGLLDDDRWGQPDGRTVGVLGQDSLAHQPFAQPLAQAPRPLLELPGAKQLDDGSADGRGQRIAPEGGAVAPRPDDPQHIGAGHHGRHRHDAAAKGLTQDVHVRDNRFVLAGEGRPGSAEAGLDLVGAEQHLLFGAQPPYLAQEAGGWDVHPGLALDGFEQYRGGVYVDGGGQCGDVSKRHHPKARHVRPEPGPGHRLRGEADDRAGAPVEVVRRDNDVGLVSGDALHLVAPLAGDLDGGLDRFRPGVHR